MFRRLFASAVCAVALLASPAAAQTSRYSPELLAPFKPLNTRFSDSTVRVRADDKDVALGTVVTADGFILTKASELRGPVTVVLTDGSVHDVELVSVHKPTDLALVRLDLKKAGVGPLKPVQFADSKKAAVGNWLCAPGPRSEPIGVGIVSVATRDLTGFERTSTINYNRGLIGIETADVTDQGGAKVTKVSKESAGETAGLKKDDVILAVNGKAVKDRLTLLELLSDYRKEETVKVKVLRGDEKVELSVTLGARVLDPNLDRGEIQNKMGSRLSGRRTGFPTVLQTDMIVDADNCGGPVCDLEGNVLGISIARAGRVETWVLPSEVIRPVLADMKSGKHPPEGSKKTAEKAGD
jgi:serine protease Do